MNVCLRDRDEKADVTELPTVAMAVRRMKKSWRFIIIVFIGFDIWLLLYGILNQIYEQHSLGRLNGVVRTELAWICRSWQGGVMVVLMGGEVSFATSSSNSV